MTTLGAKIDEDFFFLCHIPSVCAFRVFWVHSLIMRLWGAVAISLKLILTSFSPFFLEQKKKEGGGVSWLAIWWVLQWNDIWNRWFDFAGIIHSWFSFPKTASRDVIKVWGDFYEDVVWNFNCYLIFLFCGFMLWVLLKLVTASFIYFLFGQEIFSFFFPKSNKYILNKQFYLINKIKHISHRNKTHFIK